MRKYRGLSVFLVFCYLLFFFKPVRVKALDISSADKIATGIAIGIAQGSAKVYSDLKDFHGNTKLGQGFKISADYLNTIKNKIAKLITQDTCNTMIADASLNTAIDLNDYKKVLHDYYKDLNDNGLSDSVYGSDLADYSARYPYLGSAILTNSIFRYQVDIGIYGRCNDKDGKEISSLPAEQFFNNSRYIKPSTSFSSFSNYTHFYKVTSSFNNSFVSSSYVKSLVYYTFNQLSVRNSSGDIFRVVYPVATFSYFDGSSTYAVRYMCYNGLRIWNNEFVLSDYLKEVSAYPDSYFVEDNSFIPDSSKINSMTNSLAISAYNSAFGFSGLSEKRYLSSYFGSLLYAGESSINYTRPFDYPDTTQFETTRYISKEEVASVQTALANNQDVVVNDVSTDSTVPKVTVDLSTVYPDTSVDSLKDNTVVDSNATAVTNIGSTTIPTDNTDIKGFWATLWKYLENIYNGVKAIPQSIADGVNNLIKARDVDRNIDNSVSLDFKPLNISLADKFPFCVPYDLVNLFRPFAVPRKAPIFEVKFPEWVHESYRIDEQILKIDFSTFDKLAILTRYFSLTIFCYGLIIKTRSLIRG